MIRGLRNLNTSLMKTGYKVEVVQPEEEKAAWRPYSSLPVPYRGMQERWRLFTTGACSGSTRGKWLQTERAGLHWILGSKHLQWG